MPPQTKPALAIIPTEELDGKIVLLTTVSVFIHAYLCGAMALLSVACVAINRDRRLKIISIPHIRYLVAFSILALAISPIYGNWLGLAVGAAIIIILAFYLYLRTVMTISLFHALADMACIISLVYFLIALFQKIFGLQPRSPSTFQNANYYGYAVELIVILAFYRLSTVKSKTHRSFAMIVITANIAALALADCRSAWPAIFGGLTVYFTIGKRIKSIVWLIAAYAVGIILVLTFPAVFPRLDSFGFDGSIRTSIWIEALNGIKQHPVFGVGAMGYLHLSETHRFYHSHNLLLELLISFGAVGTLAIGSFFFLTLRDACRRFKADQSQMIYPLVFASITVTAIHGLTDVTILWPQTGILLALILSAVGITPPPSSSPSSS